MIGQVISHYKILEKLGEGGMGIVYRAHDTKLDRTVALKFLPPQLSATDQDKTRFTQEARAAAALNHQNICHIYRIDEVDAPPASGREGEKLMFIEMEHVDGVTLRKRIAAGPLPLTDALNLATQIGEGLEEAHGKGIIHRDIKSDNVMVNARGQAKVMDFGLAKLKGALKLTRSSSTVGTLAYMAPEQLRGVEADARSDIFSFGVLFYEMLTGRVPFEGAHEAALMYSITNEPPIPLEKFIPDAPSELLHIINRALEKDPEDRYQSVHDMVIDIRRLKKDSSRVSRTSMPAMQTPPATDAAGEVPVSATSGQVPLSPDETPAVEPGGPATGHQTPPPSHRRTSSVTIQIPAGGKSWALIGTAVVVVVALIVVGYMLIAPSDNGGPKLSVAVADFQNRTSEAELDGLSGMLTTAMEQSKRLSVVTRSRMFDILKQMGKGDVEKIDEATGKEICSRAGISALVTASISKLGRLYIIDLKVLDPSKNEYIFTAKEEGEGQEAIPVMLDNLSEKTRAGLKEKVEEIQAASTELAAVTTTNMEAYQYYFKGEEYLNKLDMDRAEEEFRKAVALDSTFGLAWYRLAYAINWSSVQTGRTNDAMTKALSLIDRIPAKERYLLRALAADRSGGFSDGITILKEMEKHYPNDKEMIYNIGDWSFHDRDYPTAIVYLNKTLEIDPVHERALQHLAWTYRATGQYSLMRDAARRYVDAAGSTESIDLLTEAYKSLGNYEDGVKEFTLLRNTHPGKPAITRDLAEFYILVGDQDMAREELDSLVASGDSAAMAEGTNGLTNLFNLTGQFRKARELIRKSITRSREARDTVSVAQKLVGLGFIEWEMAGSMERAEDCIRQSAGFNIPSANFNYWAPRAFLEVLLHPERDLPPRVTNSPLLNRILTVFLLCGRDSCSQAAPVADSLMQLLPSPARMTIAYRLAECYFNTARFSESLDMVNRALSDKSIVTEGAYPSVLALQGKIQEEMGRRSEAVSTYGKFLALWKYADVDLPLLIEVKKRAANLGRVAVR